MYERVTTEAVSDTSKDGVTNPRCRAEEQPE